MKQLFMFLVLMVSSQSFSQQMGDFQLGVFGGASISNIVSAQDLIESNLRLGFNAGLSGNYYFSELVSLELDLFYNQNGRVIDPMSSNDSQISRTLTIHYVTAAVMPNYHFGSDVNWYVKAGP